MKGFYNNHKTKNDEYNSDTKYCCGAMKELVESETIYEFMGKIVIPSLDYNQNVMEIKSCPYCDESLYNTNGTIKEFIPLEEEDKEEEDELEDELEEE